METLLGFLVLGVVSVPFIAAILIAQKFRALSSALEKLNQRVAALEIRVRDGAPVPAPASEPASVPVTPPPLVRPTVAEPRRDLLPQVQDERKLVPPPKPPRPAIDWEAFMGVKLFAWIGGFVLFLGVVFLVKYSFENNLVTPRARIAIGALIGVTLIAAGWFTARRRYRVPGQSLCATGILVLYADIFGAHAFYDLIALPEAFACMSAVTIAAFLLAVRLDAQVIVILGLLGGFLTPPLLTRGPDNPAALFGYVALLNFGVAAVALRKRWDYLVLLAALGTVLTEFAWAAIFDVAKAGPGYMIFLGLEAEFLAIYFLRKKLLPPNEWMARAAIMVGFAALAFAICLITDSHLAQRPAFIFSFIFLADIGLLALAMTRPDPTRMAGAAGSAVFFLLAGWTGFYLRHDLLWWALGSYVVFALLHSGFAVWPERAPSVSQKKSLGHLIPVLALALLCLCVWQNETSFAVWACVLLVDLIVVGLAWRSTSMFALAAALGATIFTAGLWIVTAPRLVGNLDDFLVVIGGFGIFFSGAATLVGRNYGSGTNVPVFAAALPFVLLFMVTAKLAIPDPTPIFIVALILAVVLLGFGILARTSWIAVVALIFTWAVEREWHALYFSSAHAGVPCIWYLAFCAVFTAYPFFAKDERAWIPWAVGASAGALHFWLIYDLVSSAYPALRNGLLPAAFAIPYAYGVFRLVKREGLSPASGDARLAWQAGAALFFITLIFPIQFEREWITLGWALEGCALVFAFRFIPNRGLRLVGGALLCVAFVRLALNPAVFEYHRRTGTRIWNWYLYAYGLTSICLIAAARLFQRSVVLPLEPVASPLLYSLGAVLTFLLMNIEIADYFSIGPTLTFSFSGNFARDMTYSIAWALFAFALLILGMKKQTRAVRYAGLGLLIATLLKLFLHDLGSLSQLYRIGAFIGVALILIIASFVYQRFLNPIAAPKTPEAL